MTVFESMLSEKRNNHHKASQADGWYFSHSLASCPFEGLLHAGPYGVSCTIRSFYYDIFLCLVYPTIV